MMSVFIVKETMGITKTQLYDENINLLATVFATLGHPARISILNFLIVHGSATVKQMNESIQLAQSTISEHVRVLHKISLIKSRHLGTSVQYYLHNEMFEVLADLFSDFSDEFKKSPDSDTN